MTEQNRRWIKMPAAGQLRGTGHWEPYAGPNDYWEWLIATGYLPTHTGPKAPTDTKPPQEAP